MVRKGSAIQNCRLGLPRIGSSNIPTRPSLSEPFRTDLNLSEQKFVFPNRSRPISTRLESSRPNLTYLDHHFSFFSAVNCGYLRFRPQCLNDSTIGTRPSALDYSTSLFRLPQVTVAFHDHGRSPSVAFHSLPQPNPVPSPTVTYGRLPTATEAKIAFFQKLRFRSPEQNGVKRTKTELSPRPFCILHFALCT